MWLADDVEGGVKMIFGRSLNIGLASSMDLIDLIERAFSLIGAYTPKPCREFYPRPTKSQQGYKALDPKGMIGNVEMVPVNGCAFANHQYDYSDKMYANR